MAYEVLLKRTAKAFLKGSKGLTPADREEIKDAIEELEKDPSIRPPTIEPLRNRLAPMLRYRTGSFRLIFQVYPDESLVIVLTIGWRREVYRDAERLKALPKP